MYALHTDKSDVVARWPRGPIDACTCVTSRPLVGTCVSVKKQAAGRLRGHDATPDDAYWCPNCERYSVTEELQTIQREEFGVENELWGCTGCHYCLLPATEWREIND